MELIYFVNGWTSQQGTVDEVLDSIIARPGTDVVFGIEIFGLTSIIAILERSMRLNKQSAHAYGKKFGS